MTTSTRFSRSVPQASTDQATDYAAAVVAGEIVAGKLVRAACERHLRDMKGGAERGFFWNAAKAEFAIRFFRYLRHAKGEWARKPIELAPWQAFCVGSVFGWERADGTRRFKVANLVVAKKNGKSVLLSGIGLYALLADGEMGAEVYSTATARDQARIIFDAASRMVAVSPDLSKKVRRFKLNLSVDETASKFEPISSDDKTGDGLNPSCVLIDELHRHKSRAMLDLMEHGTGARLQPMVWIISTSGDDNPVSAFNTEFEYAEKVVLGVVEDEHYFAYLAVLDKEDRWDDPAVWIKANPNLDVSVKLDDLKRQSQKAKNNPSAQTSFKRLRLNLRVSDATKAIDLDVWRRNSQGRFDPAILRGRSCYSGLDLSSKIDISAKVNLFPPLDASERWRVVARFWMPADTIDERQDRDAAQYRRWVDEGWIEATAGNVIDQDEIKAAVLADHREFPLISLAYDPWNATKLANELQNEGIALAEFIQGIRSYTAPTKELLAMLLGGKIDHGGNPVLEWMASNLKVQDDKNENLMPHKQKSTGRIDGMTALIMAIGRHLSNQDEPGSYLETDDLLIL